MHFPILRDDATWILLRRAAVMWLLVRLVFLAIGLASKSAVGPTAAGVVLLAAFLSVAEWRRRSESAFWRNLGFGLRQMISIAIAAAAAGELSFSILRYVVSHR